MVANSGGDIRWLSLQIEVLRELVRQIGGERDDLRRRLDNSDAAREQHAAEIRRLTLMLTHQQQPANQNPGPATVRPWLWFAVAVLDALFFLLK